MRSPRKVDNLIYMLRQPCDRNRDGSHATQGNRETIAGSAFRRLVRDKGLDMAMDA
jgi:hypothetical protein